MLLVDTNVLVDVLEDDPQWADWSIGQLRAQSKIHQLAINPVIYAELSVTFSAMEDLDAAIEDLGLVLLELPRPALFLAGKAFVRYRRQGGTKSNVLADFFIGAHAAVSGHAVLTRDARRYKAYFPGVVLVAPASPTSQDTQTRVGHQGPLKVVLHLAEVTDGKRIQDQQVGVFHIVDLVAGVAGDEQHASRIDVVHHLLNSDRAAP